MEKIIVDSSRLEISEAGYGSPATQGGCAKPKPAAHTGCGIKNGKPVPTVSPAEWEIMETLWKHGPQAARDVFAALPEENSRDIKTVRTLLSRLVEKGAIGYDQIGNSYLYRAEFSREQLVCHEVRSVANRVFDGSMSALFASFIREEELNPEEIEQLRQLLDERQS